MKESHTAHLLSYGESGTSAQKKPGSIIKPGERVLYVVSTIKSIAPSDETHPYIIVTNLLFVDNFCAFGYFKIK